MVVLLLGMLVVVVGVPVLATIGCIQSRRFVPDPRLRAVRLAVVAAVAVACALLLYTLTTPWYVVTRDYGREVTVNGSSGLVAFIVLASLAAGAATVSGIHGYRNFSVLPLLATWPALAAAWFEGTFYWPTGGAPSPPEARPGLSLATIAVMALTLLAAAGVVVRLCNPDPNPDPAD